jgi:hypothetical protein
MISVRMELMRVLLQRPVRERYTCRIFQKKDYMAQKKKHCIQAASHTNLHFIGISQCIVTRQTAKEPKARGNGVLSCRYYLYFI